MCDHVFMYDGRDKTTNSQINNSTKYIYRIYVEVGCKMKSIVMKKTVRYVIIIIDIIFILILISPCESMG